MTNPLSLEDGFRLFIAWLILSVLGLVLRKPFENMTKLAIVGILFRFMLAWLVVSVLGFLFGKQLMTLLIPYLIGIIHLIQDDYSAALAISDRGGGQIHLMATLDHGILMLVKGDTLDTYVGTLQFVIPVTLLFSLLAAWPVKCFQSRMTLLLLAIPLGFLLVTITVPFQLAGANEMAFQAIANQNHVTREKPFFLIWVHFLNNSGAWLRVIAVALLGSAIMQRTWLNPESPDDNIGKVNHP